MKTKEVTLYICEHCGKKYQREKACLAHEAMCYHNPENKTCCYGCKFLEKVAATHYYNYGDRLLEKKVNVFRCKKKGVYLTPPQYDNDRYDLHAENVTMPAECAEYVWQYAKG